MTQCLTNPVISAERHSTVRHQSGLTIHLHVGTLGRAMLTTDAGKHADQKLSQAVWWTRLETALLLR